MELLRLQERHITRNLEASGNSSFRQRIIWSDPPSDRITQFLNLAGFLNVSKIRQFKILPELICGLIERWRPETHTFHMPCGECTITLEDVVMQLGVPISGPPIIAQNKEAVEITCYRYLGKVPEKTDYDGKRVKLTWLKSAFQLDENSTEREVDCAARAYILVLIGGILMPDKSSAMVHTQYLPFLSLSWEAGGYSWGSAILAFLYREMCKAAKMSSVDGRALNADIGGCMVLLQSWAWYRLPFLAPICPAPSEFPLATRWRQRKDRKALDHKVTLAVRMLIDMCCESEFIWRPYLHEDVFGLIPERAYEDAENWCSIMPLIHFALVEMFYGNRVLRQFGFHQPVPAAPRNMDELEQIDTRGKTEKNWPLTHREYVDSWTARATTRPSCYPITPDDFDLSRSEYHQWLLRSSQLILTTEAEREAWLLLFPSSRHPRGSSGSSSSTVEGSSSRRGSRGDGRGRQARRGDGRGRQARRGAVEVEAEPEHEVRPEHGVHFDTGSYPHSQGDLSWEAAIRTTVFQHGTPAHLWRGEQPWSHVEGSHGNLNVPQFPFSEPQYYVPQPVDGGGAGPSSMFTTPRRMNVEEDSDDDDDNDDDDGEDDNDDDGERARVARVRNAPRRYDDTGSLHRQTLNRRRRRPQN
ncbi:hypothetical protein GQ457_18G011890 [Hibiscus cannabinus]